jgi:hypothetical protein
MYGNIASAFDQIAKIDESKLGQNGSVMAVENF